MLLNIATFILLQTQTNKYKIHLRQTPPTGRLIVERSPLLSSWTAHLTMIDQHDDQNIDNSDDHYDGQTCVHKNYQVAGLRLFPQCDPSLVESVDVEPADQSLENWHRQVQGQCSFGIILFLQPIPFILMSDLVSTMRWWGTWISLDET